MFKKYLESSHRLFSQFLQTATSDSDILNSMKNIQSGLESELKKIETLNFCHNVRSKGGGEGMGEPNELKVLSHKNMDHHSSKKQAALDDVQQLNIAEKQIVEHVVLRELLFVFQGIGGKTFEIQTDRNGFNISSELMNSPPSYYHAAHLAELGVLHLRVQKTLNSVPQVGAALCVSALLTTMRSQLGKFSLLVSQLERQLAKGEQTTTLLQFRVQTKTALHEMLWLAIVAENCRDKNGGALLTVLDSLMNHGDPRVQKYVRPFYVEVASVYYAMLGCWLKASEFYDPSSEFFIARNFLIAKTQEFWKPNYYQIMRKNRPTFISKKQAEQILEAGWNVALIKKILGENVLPKSLDELIDAAIHTAINTELGHLAWRPDGAMQICVKTLLREASSQLVHAFLKEGKLQRHLKAITGHLLLRQDNFARELVTRLGPLLDVPASEIVEHELRSELNEALLYCNIKNEELNIHDILEIKLINDHPDTDSLAWDVFTLKYKLALDDPITLVIPKKAVEMYELSFQEFLKTKQIERKLNDILKSVKTQWRLLHSNGDIAADSLRCMHLLASQMSTLLRHTHDFQHDCVEQRWQMLQNAIKKAASVTDLITAHEVFIRNVKEIICHDEENSEIKTQLSAMYELVIHLEVTATKLCSKDLAKTRKDTRVVTENCKTLKSINKKLLKLKKAFDMWMQGFLETLGSAPQEYQILAVRINYNVFYMD